jgi:flavodoxin
VKSLKSALIVYWSSTGNTQKVAYAIQVGLEVAGFKVQLKKPQEAAELDFYEYDLVCVGSPSIEWQPAKPVIDLLKAKLNLYRSQGKIKPCAPKVPGKNALVFCTYSGPHTGIDEATPAGKSISASLWSANGILSGSFTEEKTTAHWVNSATSAANRRRKTWRKLKGTWNK